MSVDKSKRRYRDYAYVVLAQPVRCPLRNSNESGFPGDKFAFFIEDGFFCIEHKGSGAIIDTAPANVRDARRKTEEALSP